MLVRELFEKSSDYVDLQALIMFLVFEKKVLSMEDDARKLNLYFLPKHRKRMNKEINQYKKKMNMNYKPNVYEVTDGKKTIYIYANNEVQAKHIAYKNLIKVDRIKVCDIDQLMYVDGLEVTLRTIVKHKKPQILGGF